MSGDPGILVARKQAILARAERQARGRSDWIARNAYYYEEDHRYLRFLVPTGLRVLELGCGIGHTLAALAPSRGVGVDFSPAMIEQARERHPELEFLVGDIEDPATIDRLEGPFDVILIGDTIGELEDCQATLARLRRLATRDTRIVIAYHSNFWEPILDTAEWLGQKMPQERQNWLSSGDIMALLDLAGFEVVKREWRQLLPKRVLGLGPLVNRYLGTLPLVNRLCLRHYVVARPQPTASLGALSATVLIPCKNERGNIEPAIQRLPRFCDDLEILFVEGGSRDGTREEIERVIAAYPEHDIRLIPQDGKGKGDAVRKGFDAARGEVLIILDADLTVPPEWIPRFYEAIVSGKGEFVNGTRLVYPMEAEAMRFLNLAANRVFSWLFTWLLNQRFTDTLCGTKVLLKQHYREIVANRAYFGDFDPFGDFDLIFGAAKLNLKVLEIPVRYASRRYGETQISRFRHGVLLLRMVLFAFRKLKAF
jgi:SAM-dependent methyltransferase